MKKTMIIMMVITMACATFGCAKNTKGLDKALGTTTVVHSYSKKTGENHWRTTSDGYGYTDSNGVYHGTSAAISLHLIANPEEEITWVNDETGWTGTSTYHGNLITGYRYTTGLRQL